MPRRGRRQAQREHLRRHVQEVWARPEEDRRRGGDVVPVPVSVVLRRHLPDVHREKSPDILRQGTLEREDPCDICKVNQKS